MSHSVRITARRAAVSRPSAGRRRLHIGVAEPDDRRSGLRQAAGDVCSPSGQRRVRALACALVPILAGWNNLVAHRLTGGEYTVVNGVATAALLAGARASGLTWTELGLAPDLAPSGALRGAAFAAPVAAGYAAAVALPVVRPVLRDARVADLSAAAVAAEALVRIPVGTVLWEEVAFRGVLRSALRRLLPARAATAVGAALFGLWHVRPTLDAVTANDVPSGTGGRAEAVLLVCLGTAATGILFDRLRGASGSLLAPVLLHLAANSLGLLAAAIAHRLRGGT